MKFRVHVYAVVRVPFDVEAENFNDAADKVLNNPATYEQLNGLPNYADETQNLVTVDKLDENGKFVSDTTLWFDDRGRVIQ